MKIVTYRTLGILSGVALGTIGWLPFVQPDTAPQWPMSRWASAEESEPKRVALGASRRDLLRKSEAAASKNGSSKDNADPHSILKRKVELLEKGYGFLKQRRDYTTMLVKQEVVQGRLLDEQRILMKCRHEPFSVYLEWHQGDVGREVIFVEGKNNGRMIAHDGGWKSRIPAFLLEPDCSLAMSDARYPITTAGLMGLVQTMLAVHKDDLTNTTVATCTHVSDGEFEGRPCHVFETTHKSRDISPTYRKSITHIDKEWNIPCSSKHYEWPKDGVEGDEADDATLIESYQFTEVQFDQSLSDRDFDATNSEYNFH